LQGEDFPSKVAQVRYSNLYYEFFFHS
jgi:hypothetical protein